jgi:hypothetical protein
MSLYLTRISRVRFGDISKQRVPEKPSEVRQTAEAKREIGV